MRRPSLDRFGLALGAYAGVLVGSVFGLVLERPLVGQQTVVVGLAALVAVWMVVAYVPDFSVAFATLRLHKALVFTPGIVLLGALWLEDAGVPSESAFGPAVVPLVALFVCGIGVAVVAERRRAARVEAREAKRAEWTAMPGTRCRWRRRAAFVGLGVVLFAGGTVLWVRSGFVGSVVIGFGISAGMRVLDVGDTEYLAAYESGLTVRDSMDATPRFVPWSRFTGYERTDNALVLRRRLPLAGFRCALDRIDDPDAIEAAVRDALG